MKLAILCFFTVRLTPSGVECLPPHSTHKLHAAITNSLGIHRCLSYWYLS